MPTEHLKQVERQFSIRSLESRAANLNTTASRNSRPQKKRKHNDSISESKLIKEKLPSSSFVTIGKSINVLIPRNNHNILESIDLTASDGAVLKQLMNNNNGDLILNGGGFECEENDNRDEFCDDSDSETVTGDESLIGPDDDDSDSDNYTIENVRKLQKRNSYVSNAVLQ